MIRALDRKLLRDMRRIRAQSLAIALVMACGIAVLIFSFGTLQNLRETREAYYERNRFADIFAEAVRIPYDLLPEFQAIEGVAQAEARIVEHFILDMPEMAEPGMGRVISLPAEPLLNVPLLRLGTLPDLDNPDEVAVAEPFARAHGLRPGDSFRAILNGQARELRVSGIALSPEYIYMIGPVSILPDDRRFGIFWMSHEALAAAFDLEGAFNHLSIALTPGARTEPVLAAVDELLDPFGGKGAHGRDRQTSHRFLDQELEQLETLAWLLPPVFFVVSAFLVNMVLGRLIAIERQQIGLLKAIGYSTFEIALHYLKMAGVIGLAAILIGWAAGLWLSGWMTRLYGEFFHFPYLVHVPSTAGFAVSGLLALATVLFGAVRAVAATVRLPPAVAMSPPAPPRFTRGLVDRLAQRLKLRQTTMMILRSITRWPGRAAVTLSGAAAALAVLVGSFFFFDAVEAMMDEMFTLSNRQQVTLNLAGERTEQAVLDALGLPGVLAAEGSYAVPVRLVHGQRQALQSLQARSEDAELERLLDRNRRPLALPPWGLILPELLARELDAAEGDELLVEFLGRERETHVLPVASVVQQSLGQSAHMRDETLFRLLRHEPRVNRINLLVDEAALPELYAEVKETPAVSGVTLWRELRQQIDRQFDESLLAAVTIYTVLGVLIAIGVIYNAARIQLAERAHELATLRVLGFSRAQVSYVLIGEIMFLTLVALPPGWLAGYGFAALSARSLSSDIASIPLVVRPATYAWCTLLVLASALVSVLMVRRRLDRVDLVSALKRKE